MTSIEDITVEVSCDNEFTVKIQSNYVFCGIMGLYRILQCYEYCDNDMRLRCSAPFIWVTFRCPFVLPHEHAETSSVDPKWGVCFTGRNLHNPLSFDRCTFSSADR